MAQNEKIAIIGHNGWAAQRIIKHLASQSFTKPLRVLARPGSSVASIPENVEVVRYVWEDESLKQALDGVAILLSFIGHEGLKDQRKLVPLLGNIKLFAPSDLALPYTSEEREHVEVPHEKELLENELKKANVPFVTIVIGNFTSFALDSPYMGVDLENNRILHTGKSRDNPVWLCSLDYVAAGYAEMLQVDPSTLAGRTIGLNELRPTTGEIEEAMHRKTGSAPKVAYDTVENARTLANTGRLDALVRKKMGDGTHGVGRDIWDVKGFKKRNLEEFISGHALDDPKYIQTDKETKHFLDEFFT